MSSKKQMVINYVPGEECRVAIVEGGRLEEFHAERMDGPSNHVGNIYVGKVMNVELGIQAAFIDFGLEQNGFLHVSDVHPQYFPGEDGDKTERVGRKTPRRERPPIQDCFRRGDEVAVQVLKEGVGTKGPTVTSYLSIPGRFLVMMPQMDKVGVSRKVEDEETRRKMREILDQLDLPDGFGFILRTAGMERSKAELKRDLAYLMRLWKDMEARWKGGSKPRLLYSESDLLVRALRDLLTSDIEEVVVDNEAALARAARFLKIVAPRTSTRVVHYTGKAPIFHVMGIEPQIQMIHAREVPLESGGRLVIDEAEALVAIDVNSGKSREARDSETNAYQTNCEAVDEICRQLRLRDLGGVIVNDLIDMRSAKHRRDIETRVTELLKKDRARWTIAPISEFGILEMTRQRMRASHESQHFTDCPTCRGRGLVQRPDSVVGDALRELAAILDEPGVARVELVVNPRIAGELLSAKRRALSRIERIAGKHVDVRVSEAINVDRVTFYAYDERGADLDVSRLGHRKARPEELVAYEISSDASDAWVDQPAEVVAPEMDDVDPQVAADIEAHPIELEPLSLSEIAAQERSGRQQPQHGQPHGAPAEDGGAPGGRRRRRRGRRGGRGHGEEFGQPGELRPGDLRPDGTRVPYPPQPVEGEYAQGDQSQYPAEGGFDENAAPYPEQAPYQDESGAPAVPGHAMNGQPPQGGEFGLGEQGQGGRKRRRRRGRRGRGGAGGPGGPDGPPLGAPGFAGQGDSGFAPGEGGYSAPIEGSDQPGFEGDYAQSYGDPMGAPGQEMGDSGILEVGAPGEDQVDGYDPNAGGPPMHAGQPGFDDGQGPRRRRRRGRRGGRGGDSGGGAPGGPAGPGGPPVARSGSPNANTGAPSLAAMFRTEPLQGDSGDAGDFAPEAPSDGGEFADGAPEGAPPAEGGFAPDGPPGEGGPRRRRRRGRRGGRGSEGGPPGTGAPRGDAPAPQSAPRPQQSAPRAPVAPPAPPRSAPAAAPAQQPKVRTLYGSTRRRIAPADIKGIKRED